MQVDLDDAEKSALVELLKQTISRAPHRGGAPR
jgi:hypothetical protein